jgi:hypothetical protein
MDELRGVPLQATPFWRALWGPPQEEEEEEGDCKGCLVGWFGKYSTGTSSSD